MSTKLLIRNFPIDVAIVGLGALGRSLLHNYRQVYPELRYTAVVRKTPSPIISSKIGITYYGTRFRAQQIMLCVKPHQAQELCQTIKRDVGVDTVVVSAMAAVPQHKLEAWLGTSNVVKIMPSILTQGPIVVYNPHNIKLILPRNSIVHVDNEKDLDLATATCGCVPGFMAAIIEQLVIAAQSLGVDHTTAQAIILGNLRALANDNVRTINDLQTLRAKVATKGGATEKGILQLEQNNNLLNLFDKMFKAADAHIITLRNKLDE